MTGDCRFFRPPALALLGLTLAAGAVQAASPPDLVEDNCVTCHNSSDWAGGLAFDILSFDNLHADAGVWEETIRKLRGRLMPPPDEPQPRQAEIDAFVGWLETRLDAAAATAPPDPGFVGLHRLNRNEYGREIQRILDLKVDVTELLPRDAGMWAWWWSWCGPSRRRLVGCVRAIPYVVRSAQIFTASSCGKGARRSGPSSWSRTHSDSS